MIKEQIENRMKELETEFEKVKTVSTSAGNRLIQLQGAYAELKKLLENIKEDVPEKNEAEMRLENK